MTTKPRGNSGLPFIYIALPVMDEPEHLPRLLDCLSVQSYKQFRLFICVNQPEAWWDDPVKCTACKNNRATLHLLHGWSGFDITVIDRTSTGHGWTGKQHGIGYARKTLMDQINIVANPEDIIVSMDADTVFSENYLWSVAENFQKHPGSAALAVPYFHKTPPDGDVARAMLRYEIYMRHYFLNLARIGSPYAFTALGSAMAFPVWAYRAIGGMTPKLSGEDFYLLQKLRKYGHVLLWNDELVYPESRYSDRVFFGTGPAMIKGAAGDWTSYPIYPMTLFDEILETYQLLPNIFVQSLDTRVVRFIATTFREADPLQPLRLNHKKPAQFIRAFHEKFDGLRILQYLKTTWESDPGNDEVNLLEFLTRCYPPEEFAQLQVDRDSFSFSRSPVDVLEKIRMFLFQKEMEVRSTSTLP
ncbi:MAG: glycosyltransferase family 2 protein [Bacteroidales bacterium]|nr:glycosyltransferase family 2 protein [Bacteroidales bacterium]